VNQRPKQGVLRPSPRQLRWRSPSSVGGPKGTATPRWNAPAGGRGRRGTCAQSDGTRKDGWHHRRRRGSTLHAYQGFIARMPLHTCSHDLAWGHASTASLHACHSIHARMPRRGCTHRRLHCAHATPYVHACPGAGARIDGVIARMPRRTCVDAVAYVHECAGAGPRMRGMPAQTPGGRARTPLAGERKSQNLRGVAHFLQKIDTRHGRNAVFASSHLRDVDAGANHARAWALTAAASPRKEERQS
jgi:hypothetical protein